MSFVLYDKLLELCVIRNIAIMVNSSSFETSATHLPSSSGYQKQLKAIFWALIVYKALYKTDKPMCSNLLRFEILTHIEVPHVSRVHRFFIANIGSLYSNLLSVHVLLNLLSLYGSFLSIESKLEIVTIVKAMSQILFDLFFNRINHRHLFLADASIYRNELNFTQLEYNRWILIRSDR